MLWRLLQIADSGFPTGGFAHSCGLESMLQHGEIRNIDELKNFLNDALWQIGYSSFPFANVTYSDIKRLFYSDQLADIFLSNHVANRASRIQGRVFFSTCENTFSNEITSFLMLKDYVSNQENKNHLAPIYGAMMKCLMIEKSLMQKALLHLSLRSMLSASVRLGVIGPYQGQQLQNQLATTLEAIIHHCKDFELEDLAQTVPLHDLYQANQDRLYSRLFQS